MRAVRCAETTFAFRLRRGVVRELLSSTPSLGNRMTLLAQQAQPFPIASVRRHRPTNTQTGRGFRRNWKYSLFRPDRRVDHQTGLACRSASCATASTPSHSACHAQDSRRSRSLIFTAPDTMRSSTPASQVKGSRPLIRFPGDCFDHEQSAHADFEATMIKALSRKAYQLCHVDERGQNGRFLSTFDELKAMADKQAARYADQAR